jgi:prepilin-type N-terminal cleavage/methylation domain-containing protein
MITNERGFTLAEVLIAVAIISIGLVGLASVIPLAAFGIQQGNQFTTATFLAEQRLEQARNSPWNGALFPSPLPVGWTAPVDCLGTSTGNAAPSTTTCNVSPCVNGVSCTALPDESSGAIAGFPGYSRTVRITDCSVAPGCGTAPNIVLSADARLVTVAVTFLPITAVGDAPAGQTYTVSVDLLVARR